MRVTNARQNARQLIADVLNVGVVLEVGADRNGRHPLRVISILLDDQAAHVEVVQPYIAVVNAQRAACSAVNIVRQGSKTETIGCEAEFDPAKQILGDRQGVKVLPAETYVRGCYGWLAEEIAFLGRVYQIGHRRDPATAYAFDRMERKRRPLFIRGVLGHGIGAEGECRNSGHNTQ